MVKQATAEVVSRGGGQGIDIATVEGPPTETVSTACSGTGGSCGGHSALEW